MTTRGMAHTLEVQTIELTSRERSLPSCRCWEHKNRKNRHVGTTESKEVGCTRHRWAVLPALALAAIDSKASQRLGLLWMHQGIPTSEGALRICRSRNLDNAEDRKFDILATCMLCFSNVHRNRPLVRRWPDGSHFAFPSTSSLYSITRKSHG